MKRKTNSKQLRMVFSSFSGRAERVIHKKEGLIRGFKKHLRNFLALAKRESK